jgi:cytochrome c peroxidase
MSKSQFILGILAAAVVMGCAERDLTDPDPILLKQSGDMPAPDPEMIALGKLLFFDMELSVNGNQSCATCHDPAWGFTGPDSDLNAHGAVYEGSVSGLFGNRKPPSSAYATLSPVLHYDGDLFIGGNFWDGRATGEDLGNPAADQARGPFLNPVEQALPTKSAVTSIVCDAERPNSYRDLFIAVWGDSVCDDEEEHVEEAYDAIALSIAAYEASPESNAFTSKFDAYVLGMADLTKLEKRGLALFRGKGKCKKCHLLGKGNMEPALFTDFTFDNLGIPANPENPWYGMTEFNPDGVNWIDYGLGGFLETRSDYVDLAPDFLGQHKVPTLRNVDRRPSSDDVKAFGHNGYFKSLEQIVNFYNTRDVKPTCPGPNTYTATEAMAADCWPAPEVPMNVNTSELGNLRLSSEDEVALVAFMRTLSDGYMSP